MVGGVVGEPIMVAGYFGYAGLLLGKGIGAAASIPGNLVQGAMGLVIGLCCSPCSSAARLWTNWHSVVN